MQVFSIIVGVALLSGVLFLLGWNTYKLIKTLLERRRKTKDNKLEKGGEE